ncbi:MAG: hypothetical protein IPL14_04475 [Nitrospira sp.]|nr:hypothetical protein [Nitrospira sp.]
MYDRVTDSVRQVFAWMERLDRWGYITVGFSLLVISVLLFVHSWAQFATAYRTEPFLLISLTLVNQLLLVIILLELFRTIVRFLETDTLRVGRTRRSASSRAYGACSRPARGWETSGMYRRIFSSGI